MNKWMGTGRMVRDAKVSYSGNNQTCIARFTLAVDRRFKREGEANADFISCIAFGKTGEFVEKYGHKGIKWDVVGRIQTGSYQDKDGKTVYTTDVVVEEMEFGESKNAQGKAEQTESKAEPKEEADDFTNVPDDVENLPFN